MPPSPQKFEKAMANWDKQYKSTFSYTGQLLTLHVFFLGSGRVKICRPYTPCDQLCRGQDLGFSYLLDNWMNFLQILPCCRLHPGLPVHRSQGYTYFSYSCSHSTQMNNLPFFYVMFPTTYSNLKNWPSMIWQVKKNFDPPPPSRRSQLITHSPPGSLQMTPPPPSLLQQYTSSIISCSGSLLE